jgi:hypothetical protein
MTVAPELTIAVTVAVLLVTLFPAESLTSTTGWVANAVPETAPAAFVVIASLAAVPAAATVTV